MRRLVSRRDALQKAARAHGALSDTLYWTWDISLSHDMSMVPRDANGAFMLILHPTVRRILIALVAIALSDGASAADRIGIRDTCDSVEGWVVGMSPSNPGGQAPKKMVSEGGMLVVDTVRGALSGEFTRVYRKFGMETGRSSTHLSKSYGDVDLDRYHYLVVRLHSNQTHALLSVNNKGTKVLYTTGLHAQDLRELGFKGRQPITVQVFLNNTTGRFVLDELLLVSELTPEERKGLIPRGFEIRSQGLKCHPYQGLEGLLDRGRAPLVELRKSNALAGGEGRAEWAVFRDGATGAPVTRLTRYPGAESASEFSANGRFIRCRSPYHPGARDNVYDLRTQTMGPLPEGQHFLDPRDGNSSLLVSLERERGRTDGRIIVQRCDLATGRLAPLVDQRIDPMPDGSIEDAAFGRESGRFVIGFREHDIVYVFDPEPRGPVRMRAVKLPYPIKGLKIAGHDRAILFHACFTYQTVRYDLDSGKEVLQPRWFGGGHTALGETHALGPYGKVMKIVVPTELCTDQPGDAIRIHGNYHNCRVPVDYGTVSPDGRWAFQDGHGKGPVDLDQQIAGFDLAEGGNVIPIWFYQGSRSNWGILPYLKVSPDSTKLLLQSSDMLGSGDIYMAPFQRPEPPRELAVAQTPKGLRLTWKNPRQCEELCGYNVYRGKGRGVGFRRINGGLVNGNEFVDPAGGPAAAYLVTAIDNSGLESRFPAPAMLAGGARDDGIAVFLEAECADQVALPFRRQYDGSAANFGTMRLMPQTPEEIEGQLLFTLAADRLHATGNRRYAVALRCRLRSDIYPEARDDKMGAEIRIDGRSAGRAVAGPGPKFTWCPVAGEGLGPGKHEVAIQSKTAGLEIDRVVIFDDRVERAWLAGGAGDPEPELAVPAVQGGARLMAKADGPYAIELKWPDAPKDPPVDYYSIHASAKSPVEIGNATLVGSTRQVRFRDAGMRPGTTQAYRVVGYDTRGRNVISYDGQGRSDEGPKPITLPLRIADASIDGGLERAEYEGRALVRAVRQAGQRGKATLTFDVPKAGDYAIWFYGRSRKAGVSTSATLDQIGSSVIIGGYIDPLLIPGLGPEKSAPWLLQRMVLQPRTPAGRSAGQDVFPLTAGKHTLTLSTGPADAKGFSDEFGDVIISNDLTWTPDGYKARELFGAVGLGE